MVKYNEIWGSMMVLFRVYASYLPLRYLHQFQLVVVFYTNIALMRETKWRGNDITYYYLILKLILLQL